MERSSTSVIKLLQMLQLFHLCEWDEPHSEGLTTVNYLNNFVSYEMFKFVSDLKCLFHIVITTWNSKRKHYQNFNSPPCDLGGNGQCLKERCLLRPKSSVNCWNFNINGCNCTSFSRSCHFVAFDNIPNLIQILFGEHKAYISFNVREKSKNNKL